MPVTCNVVDTAGDAGVYSFDEVPRSGDFILLPGAGERQVTGVVFAAITPGAVVNVEIRIT